MLGAIANTARWAVGYSDEQEVQRADEAHGDLANVRSEVRSVREQASGEVQAGEANEQAQANKRVQSPEQASAVLKDSAQAIAYNAEPLLEASRGAEIRGVADLVSNLGNGMAAMPLDSLPTGAARQRWGIAITQVTEQNRKIEELANTVTTLQAQLGELEQRGSDECAKEST